MRGMRIICIAATEVAAPKNVYSVGRRSFVSGFGSSFRFEFLIMTHATIHNKRMYMLSTCNVDVPKKAKSYKINLSKSFEACLGGLVRKREEKKWKEENRDAINEYNERIEERGVFSDSLRSF
jgi:antitoxin CcdA